MSGIKRGGAVVMGPGNNMASCSRCGARIKIPLPMSVTAFSKWVDFQEEVHKTCTKRPECSGISASWCARCGDCACPRLESGEPEGDLNDPECPLHAPDSTHAETGGAA